MSDTKFFGKCEVCPRLGFFIRKRRIVLKIGGPAKSQKKMCSKCFKTISKALK